MAYKAILFDLLTALVDSWSLFADVAGSEERGRNWREVYLKLTYATGPYRDYEQILGEAAVQAGYPFDYGAALIGRWSELQAWPEAVAVLGRLRPHFALGIVTNCSIGLGTSAARSLGDFAVVVTAQKAGFYKPNPQPYEMALDELRLAAHEVLFVAGSGFDLIGATAVGMPVYWHNRVGLMAPEGAPPPLAESKTLTDLPMWLGC